MSRFEERIMELIHQLREEIRMNDQRIKQLSGGSGGGIDLTAIMLKAIYDQDEDGIVDNAKRLDGYTLEEILSQGGGGGGSGDMLKAVYDTDNDGVVDNAEKLDGHPASDFAPASHLHSEGDLNLYDVETGNVSTQRHGFCPKLPGDGTKFFDGSGQFSVPELHGGGVLDTDIRYEEQNDILFYHEPTGKWMNLSRFKGVLIDSYELLATYSSHITEGICASEDAVFGTYIDEIYKFTKTGSPQVVKVITSVDGCGRAEDMFYYNGVVYVVQNNYPSTPRKAYVVKYRSSDLQYLGYITLNNNHYATTIARDDNGHWWLTGGANPVYVYHYDENWNYINSQILVPNLGTYGYQGIFWRRGHLYANTHYGNDDPYLDIFSYDPTTDTFTRIARVSHYIDGNQNGQGVKPDPVEQDVLWWVKSQHAAHIKTKVVWSTSSIPFELFNISFANGKAQMTTEPTQDADIATKKYIDDKAAGITNKFTDLTDTPSSYSGGGGKLVRVKADESGLEFVSPSAGELDDFLDLADTPSSYSGAGGKIVGVKADESGLEFITPSSGSGRNVIIDEAFNGLTVGNIAGQGSYAFASAWQAETSGTAQVVVKDGSDKCLEITANAGTSLNVKTIFSNKFGLTPGCRVSWKMKISSDVSGISGGVLIADATPTTRASVRFGYSSGLKLRVYNGSTNVDIMAASKDIWYQIDMIYFPSYSANGAILVWVDGVFRGVYANYGGIAAGGKGIQELRMYITSPSGSAEKIYIDDLFVEVYHPLEAA